MTIILLVKKELPLEQSDATNIFFAPRFQIENLVFFAPNTLDELLG